MKTIRRIIMFILGIIVVLGVAIWIGLLLHPAAFPQYHGETPTLETIPVPDGLPAPVQRFYETIVGKEVPVLDTAVLDMNGTIRLGGITFPSRMRFVHEAGQSYRHYIEATFFRAPVLKANETYLQGNGRMELPFGVIENSPYVNSSANMVLWSEAIWYPAIWLTDERVRWEAIDDNTARLIIPFGTEDEREQVFTVRFDPSTHLITTMTASRYKGEEDLRVDWTVIISDWQAWHGILIPVDCGIQWADEKTPWLTLQVTDVIYNVDVSDYIRSKEI